MAGDNLIYNPGLEKTDNRGSRTNLFVVLIISSMCLPAYVGAILALIFYGRYIELIGIIGLYIILSLPILILIRLLFSCDCCATDADGILIRGPLKRVFIPWHSIIRITRLKGSAYQNRIVIESTENKLKINLDGLGSTSYSASRVIASIHQYMSKHGYDHNLSLNDKDRSYFAEICDDIPHNPEWYAKNPKADLVGSISMMVLFSAPLVAGIFKNGFDIRNLVFVGLFLFPVLGLYRMFRRECFRKAVAIKINDNSLDLALSCKKISIPWEQIVSAERHQGIELTWNDGRKHTIKLPYIEGNKDSENVMLAIIRKLRSIPNPIALPLPQLITRNPEVLQKATSSSSARGAMRIAFLETLEPRVRVKIKRLYTFVNLVPLVGIALAIIPVLTDAFAHISRMLHSGPDTVFFFSPDSMWAGVPLIIIALVLSYGIGLEIAYKLAGKDLITWQGFL